MIERSAHTLIILRYLLSAGLLLFVFGVLLSGVTADSFWLDEGYSAWVIHDSARDPNGLRETARFVRDSLFTALDRVHADVHPPLYYLLLDGWSLLAGDSDFALRLPSTLMMVVAATGTLALGWHWASWRAGWFALAILSTHGYFLYYARDARMYGLYLALTVLTTLAYSQWWRRRSWIAAFVYALTGSALLYTHYTAFTILLVHGLHALLTLITDRRRGWMLVIVYSVMVGVFLPWMPTFQAQFEFNTGFAAPAALSANWGTAAALYLVLTSGYWGVFALALLVSRRLPQFVAMSHWRSLALLLGLWLLLPPMILLLATNQGLPIFQLRYVIVIAPAGALLIGIALTRTWFDRWQQVNLVLGLFFVLWIGYTQLAMYREFWPEKPRWRQAVTMASATRDGLEPALVYADPRSPLMHYDRQITPFGGLRLDLYWVTPDVVELAAQVARWPDDQALWLIAEMAAPTSWDALAAITNGREVGYRDSVQGTIFYRFDPEAEDTLNFTFGDAITIENTPIEARQAAAGQRICTQSVIRLQDDTQRYRVSLHLTRGYNEIITQEHYALVTINELCLTIPDETTPDTYHLRLMMHDAVTGARLPLLESGLLWGDYLMLANVMIQP